MDDINNDKYIDLALYSYMEQYGMNIQLEPRLGHDLIAGICHYHNS